VAEQVMMGVFASPRDMIGVAHPENGWVVDADMAVHIARYIELLRREIGAGRVEVERFVRLNAAIAGTTDAWGIVGPGHVKGVDLKYGFDPVEAQFNPQVSIYLGALIRSLPQGSVQTVTVAIYQPRAVHPFGHYRQWAVDVATFMQWVDTIASRGDLCQSDNPQLLAGSWCANCDAAGTCPALAISLYQTYGVAQLSEQRDLRSEELTSELQFLRRAAKLFETRIKMVEAEIEGRISNGEKFPGWTLMRGSGKRRFKYDISALRAILGTSVVEEKLVTPAELERRKIHPSVVAALTEVPQTAPKLQQVPEGYFDAVFGLTSKGVSPHG
jgi:hypothetical protein